MSDHVSREAFIADCEGRYCAPCKEQGEDANGVICRACWVDDMLSEVLDAPAADVEPANRWIPCSEQNKIGDLKYDAQEREKAVVQLRKKWQAAEMFICTMCGHFDYSIDGNIVYGNKDCGEIVGYPCCKKFTPWIPTSVRLPEELEPVNVVWVNHSPEQYHQEIKDVPQKATAVYYREKWYWWSCLCEDLLAEFGVNTVDFVDSDIEITHWMPLPELPEEGGNENAQK